MRRLTGLQVPLAIAGASLLAAAYGDAGRLGLRWDREAIAGGELWRLVTGHFVHLNLGHFVLNLAGLVLVWVLVGTRYRALGWWIVTILCIAAMDIGFLLFDPRLSWYVGLSGLLHGLLLAGTVGRLREAPFESAVLTLVVALKLAYEQYAGPLPGSEASAGGPVVVDAHLYGAIAGTAAGAVSLLYNARPLRKSAGRIE
jgi:rhomboid family GlyGly-CTERM serine protease